MKKGIHPDYHFVTVALNDGTSYRTRTTWGESDAKMTLDIDPTTHPAWTGGQQNLLDRTFRRSQQGRPGQRGQQPGQRGQPGQQGQPGQPGDGDGDGDGGADSEIGRAHV